MKNKIADCIHTKEIYQRICIQNISFRFTHLAVALKQPGMSKHLLGKGQIQSHQENRPVNGMETDNILTNQMKICRPEFVKQLAVIAITVIAQTSNIVGQSIQPYIGYMLRIKGYRNAPGKGGSGYAQILQSWKQEVVHHLIFPGYRLNKLRMLINISNQAIRILAHFEEIRLFLCRLNLPAAVRALAVY